MLKGNQSTEYMARPWWPWMLDTQDHEHEASAGTSVSTGTVAPGVGPTPALTAAKLPARNSGDKYANAATLLSGLLAASGCADVASCAELAGAQMRSVLSSEQEAKRA